MPDRLNDFPLCVKCVSSDATVFVACPLPCRYGDVRKTLATILQCPFATINIGPIEEDLETPSPVAGAGAAARTLFGNPFPSSETVPVPTTAGGGANNGNVPNELDGFMTVAILRRNDSGKWLRA